jgi:threonine/homoserine/homoserine lactone efflux protein
MFAGIDQLGLFIVAGLLLNLTPGPDVLCIVSHGLRSGWRAGAVAALGITAGCFVHVAAATVGLGALVSASAAAFAALKWVGAAYLLYIGASMLLARRGTVQSLPAVRPSDDLAGAPVVPLRKVFAQGFWTNALNPKVALFFLAFLPQFIHRDAASKTFTFLLLGLIFIVNSLPVNLGYGLGAAWLSGRLVAARRGLDWLERGAGALFIYFGIRLATAAHPHP